MSEIQPEPLTTIVIPNWNGERWLPALFASIREQSLQPSEVIVVDNGSTDSSLEMLAAMTPAPTLVSLPSNAGFAAAVNLGIRKATTEFVALVNTDIVLERDWIERTQASLSADDRAGSAQTKMLDLSDPTMIYDTGNWLRRDGAAEQRGRWRRDSGDFDQPGEVWSACAGAALYRRDAVLRVGGFDELLFTYLEDVELGLRLHLDGWKCLYIPSVALHAGGGSEGALSEGAAHWVERNTLIIVFGYFPLRWAVPVLYRQVAWLIDHARKGTLKAFLSGMAAGLKLAPQALRARRRRDLSRVPAVIENRPWRGKRAGGHPLSPH